MKDGQDSGEQYSGHIKFFDDLKNINLHPSTIKRVLLCFAAVNLSGLVWYLWIGYKPFFHSDAAVQNLLAQSIKTSGEWFPATWNYANGDLWVFGMHSLILPLLSFFPNSFALYSFAGTLFLLCFFCSGWFFSGLIYKKNNNFRILFIALLATGFSPYLAETLYGEGAYGRISAITFLYIFLSWQSLNHLTFRRFFYRSGVFLLTLWVTFSNPLRSLVIMVFPILTATTVWFLENVSGTGDGKFKRRSGLFLVLIIATGFITGYIFHQNVLLRVHSSLGAADLKWLPLPAMLNNLGHTISGILIQFGAQPDAKAQVVGISGIYPALRLIVGVLLLFLMPTSLFYTLKNGEPEIKFIAVFTTMTLAVILFLQLTTTLPDMSDPIGSCRYLVPGLLLLLALVIRELWCTQIPFWRRLLIGSISFILLFGAPLSFIAKDPEILKRPVFYARLAHFLESHGLTYGYSDYWHSGVVSVISAGRVKVRQITWNNGLTQPRRWLSDDRWYRPSAWTGTTFIMLGNKSKEHGDSSQMRKIHGSPVQVLDFENYFKIFVYNHNLALDLDLGWDLSFEKKHTFTVTPDSRTVVGTYHPAAKSGSAAYLAAPPDVKGNLLFGPYITVDPGTYRAQFDLQCTGISKNKPVARVEIAHTGGNVMPTWKTLTHDSVGAELIFTLKRRVTDLELKVHTYGGSLVKVYSVSLQNTGENRAEKDEARH